MSLRPRARAGSMPVNRVLVGDCLEELAKLPAASVDLVFADPPYNLQLERDLLRPNNTKVDGVDDAWDKFSSFADYDRFSRAWLGECRRILKPDGAIWVIGSYHNIFRLGVALQDLGFWIQNDVIWRKINPMPNFRGKRFTNAHETLIWAGRDAEVARHLQLRGHEGAQRRHPDALRLAVSDLLGPGAAEGRRGTQGAPDAEAGGAAASPAAGHHQSGRPGARSVLRHRHHGRGRQARSAGAGSASSAIRPTRPPPRSASPACGRCAVGAGDGQVQARTSRACRSAPSSSSAFSRPAARSPTSAGHIRAEVKADGTLAIAGRQGSIHRLGAEMQGKAACNGWTFWHFEVEGRRKPIDALREEARRQLGLSGGDLGRGCSRGVGRSAPD